MSEFISPVGRIVQGSVFDVQTTDNKGQPLVVKTGPNKGQPTQRTFLAVAFKKTQAAWWAEGEWFANIYNTARQGYPQHFDPATGACRHPRMAFKVMDGDGTDENGTSNATKEGFAGHWVVKFSSNFVPQGIMNGATLNPQDPAQKGAINRGDFVRVIGDMQPNIGSDVPGVYMNHRGVEFIAYGPRIQSGPNMAAIAAANPYSGPLPEGATMTPPAPVATPAMPAAPGAPMTAPHAPGTPAVVMPSPQNPAPMAMPIPQPGAPAAAAMPPMPASMPAPAGIVPNHQFVAGATGVPQPGAPAAAAPLPPMPAAAPAVPTGPAYQMTAAAGGFTREQYNAQGWTDAVLVERGMMVRTA